MPRILSILAGFAILLAITACGPGPAAGLGATSGQAASPPSAEAADRNAPVPEPHAGDHDQLAPLDVTAPLDDHSLYHLDGTWTTHRGDELALADFRGRPTVVVMLYANCATACPILIRDALRLEESLRDGARDTTQFAMVTIDPARDAPETLAAYVQANDLDAPNWHFLSGSESQTRALAALLGVQYRDAGNGMFSHTNLVTVLDSEGIVAVRTEGLGQPVEPAARAIAALAAQERQ